MLMLVVKYECSIIYMSCTAVATWGALGATKNILTKLGLYIVYVPVITDSCISY